MYTSTWTRLTRDRT